MSCPGNCPPRPSSLGDLMFPFLSQSLSPRRQAPLLPSATAIQGFPVARATVCGNASLDGIEEKAEANLQAGKQPNEWRKPGGRKWSDLTMGGAELSNYTVSLTRAPSHRDHPGSWFLNTRAITPPRDSDSENWWYARGSLCCNGSVELTNTAGASLGHTQIYLHKLDPTRKIS